MNVTKVRERELANFDVVMDERWEMLNDWSLFAIKMETRAWEGKGRHLLIV